MSASQPDREWWSSREIAEASLPDCPSSTRGVEGMAKRLEWRCSTELAQRRPGRGGGWEYHWSLLPIRAQQVLLADTEPAVSAKKPERRSRDEAWAFFEALPEPVKKKARARVEALQSVDTLIAGGSTKFLAVSMVAKQIGVSERTVWNWAGLVEGVRSDDWLPHLAPRHRAAKRAATKVECSPEFFEYLKGDYLRLDKPSFNSCYRRACAAARKNGWKTLPERTMRRRVEAEVPKTAQVYARDGLEALKRLYPAQTRDKTALHALEAVNGDYHRWDVFVKWPLEGSKTEFEIIRPQMIAFQDIYSGRILSWRIDRTPNKTGVALALGDMIERFGIPEHMLLDNGREFANKFLTGQAETRNRFKIKDDDIPGLLVSLGVKIHWATPYSGQSKPIERAFRDMCDAIAKDPRFSGAYTGNKPDAKPENYGSKAVPLDTFLDVVAQGIEAHNAQEGRRSVTAAGRSFVETFDASYAEAPIRKATEEQRRMWLMGAEGLNAKRGSGQIRFMQNEYWSPWMTTIQGQRVVARFDPANLWDGLHLYDLENRYLGHAECLAKAGFFDVNEGRAHARARRQWVVAERKVLEATRRMRLAEIGRHLNDIPLEASDPPEARVVKPVFNTKRPTPEPYKAPAATHAAVVEDLDKSRAKPAPDSRDEARARFQQALELEARLANDEPVSAEQCDWLKQYQSTSEYRAERALFDDYGKDMFSS